MPRIPDLPIAVRVVARTLFGAVAWTFGVAVLFGVVVLSAIPYGGGSFFPMYLVVPLTAGVIVWILKPLWDVRATWWIVFMLVLFALAGVLLARAYQQWVSEPDRRRERERQAFVTAFEAHAAHFRKLCESAGPRVFRHVPDVAGFVVYGVGKPVTREALSSRDFVGDVYTGFDTSFYGPETMFLNQFLTKTQWDARNHTPDDDERMRYAYIEMPGEEGGRSGYHRYTDDSGPNMYRQLKTFSERSTSAYAVRIQDISTPADRMHWIAGTRWTVVEVVTGDVLGEFVGYAIDLAQGEPGWAPWQRAGHAGWGGPHGVANACPAKDPVKPALANRDFLRAVLGPTSQEVKIIATPR